MISSGINLVMTVIGFAVSTMFIVFVCTRLVCARFQLNTSRRSFSFPIASSILDLASNGLEPVVVAKFPIKKYTGDSFLTAEDAQLKRSIYSLKQAPRAWYNEFKGSLLDSNFSQSKSDSLLFIYHAGGHTMYFLVYIDDLLITGSSTSLVHEIITNLSKHFSLKDLRQVNFFLGIEIIPTSTGMLISQNQYICSLLDRIKMDGAKDVQTPQSTSITLKLQDGTNPIDATENRKVIGALQYVLFT